MRDRLIELIREAKKNMKGANSDLHREYLFADYLLENGVIVPPVRIGQTCYKVYNKEITEVKVVSITYEQLPAFSYVIRFNTIGVLCLLPDGTRHELLSSKIFLTKAEAEKHLKGGVQE